jgi:hypothetical protein
MPTISDISLAQLRHLYAHPDLNRGLAEGLLAPIIRDIETSTQRPLVEDSTQPPSFHRDADRLRALSKRNAAIRGVFEAAEEMRAAAAKYVEGWNHSGNSDIVRAAALRMGDEIRALPLIPLDPPGHDDMKRLAAILREEAAGLDRRANAIRNREAEIRDLRDHPLAPRNNPYATYSCEDCGDDCAADDYGACAECGKPCRMERR